MIKRIFLDVESTGLDEVKYDVIEIGCIIDYNGEIQDERKFQCAPRSENASHSALEVSGYTLDQIMNFPDPDLIHLSFVDFLACHVNRHSKKDKLFLTGYYVHFDEKFLRQFFIKAMDNFYGSWFYNPPVDVATLAMEFLAEERSSMSDFKLGTVAEKLGVKVAWKDLHGALYDANLTRDIYYKIVSS